ncbi:MAG: AAA family ATPase, partial [Pseudonocardia sediminis]
MEAVIVGRARERAELDRALDGLVGGAGAAVLVTGEAGIGKSTLLAGLTARAAAAAVPVLLGRCVPDRGVPEFWTWSRLLATPAAAELGLHPALVEVDAVDAPATARFRAVARCAEQLATAATADGLVVACEDVHWADQASLALLEHLARDSAASRLLVVATSRDPLPVALGKLAGQTGVLRITLGPLGAADVRDYLCGLDGADPLSLHRRSGGNPLYLRELVRQRDDEDIGTALRDLLLRRLDDLDAGTRTLLDGAAVLGDEVD